MGAAAQKDRVPGLIGFDEWINRFISDGAYPFMVPVLREFVLPHHTAIAFLVAYGELAIELSLVLGLLVRTASICGIMYMLTLLFSSNYPVRELLNDPAKNSAHGAKTCCLFASPY